MTDDLQIDTGETLVSREWHLPEETGREAKCHLCLHHVKVGPACVMT